MSYYTYVSLCIMDTFCNVFLMKPVNVLHIYSDELYRTMVLCNSKTSIRFKITVLVTDELNWLPLGSVLCSLNF